MALEHYKNVLIKSKKNNVCGELLDCLKVINTPESKDEVLKLLQLLSDQGDKNAKYGLAEIFIKGSIANRDVEKGMVLLKELNEEKYKPATVLLGKLSKDYKT